MWARSKEAHHPWTYYKYFPRSATILDRRQTLFWLLSLLVSLGALQHAADATEAHRGSAYFNASLGSSLTLDTTLDMQGQIAFSFRTCAYGQLLRQQGESGNFLRLVLTSNGSLELSWLGSDGSGQTVLTSRSYRDNNWYTVEIQFQTGEIHFSVERGSELLERVLVANDTYRRYVWYLQLSGGSGLQVGSGFTGCIMEGPGVRLSEANTNAVNVVWGQCDKELHRMCVPVEPNPCWAYPCSNGGSCTQVPDGFACSCLLPYSGRRCESDLGSLGCKLLPCQNNGTCRPRDVGTRRYQCECSRGYTGVNCEIDIDECASTPCKNGGLCLNLVDAYQCNCSGTGHTGVTCTENVNECEELAPCQNLAICSDTPGSYKCHCPNGYAGKNCETDLDECSSNPCRGDATCHDYVGYYMCACSTGFTGVHCEIDINDCEGITCAVPKTTCVDAIASYYCQCQSGYYSVSETDGHANACQEIDECAEAPCQHNSTCVDMVNGYTCNCTLGYTGENCEKDIDECASEPCQNGARCVDLVANFLCECLPGYTGVLCAVDIDECESAPCKNGATCHEGVNSYNCTCVPGWVGHQCDEQVLECLSRPCLNGATCEDELNGYACHCSIGFAGAQCETNIDDCIPSPCHNGGTCVDGVNKYECECTQEWMGQNCTQVYDACAFEPCENNGTCNSLPPEHEYTCRCTVGFSGENCQMNDDDCANVTCASYLVCVDGINGYTCQCPVGYTGQQCEIDIDECASNPCKNGGTCTQHVGGYTCACVSEMVNLSEYVGRDDAIYKVGFEGVNCEKDLDECSYKPSICLNKGICARVNNTYTFKCYCASGGEYYTGKYCEIKKDYCAIAPILDRPVCHNGGTCRDIGDAFNCTCMPGYTGERCKVNIDECASQPCQYDSECVDGVNGYTCLCEPGLTGTNCEIDIEECASNPCRNGGVCNELINGFTCNCNETGFFGTFCERNIDECISDPCQNGATCVDGVKGYTCQCYAGYEGSHCEMDINECVSSPCQHGGTCEERSLTRRVSPAMASGYDCSCMPGYSGDHCEVDIDECASSPCIYGTCIDAVNHYTCGCQAGYYGDHCELEIDECAELSPCRHGSVCTDLVADYFCDCGPQLANLPTYRGKNCSTLLIGCDIHKCQNGATCWPILVNERLGEHNYRCECAPGFSGELCNEVTTAWFDAGPGMPVENWHDSVSMQFRTTVVGGILVAVDGPDGAARVVESMLVLRLQDERTLVVDYGNVSFVLHAPDDIRLNDTLWHQVELSFDINKNLLHMVLVDEKCPRERRCVSSIQLQTGLSLGRVYFGGGSIPTGGFTGCMQDMKVADTYMLPGNTLPDERVGCGRTDQCSPDPCNAHGDCTDLWFRFKCHCRRPYYSADCSKAVPAATFGYGQEESWAMFVIPESARTRLRHLADVSLFFRTRQSTGLLYYIGSEPTAAEATYILLKLDAGHPTAEVWLGEGEKTSLTSERQFADGEQHFLRLTREQDSLQMSVDGAIVGEKALTTSGELEANQLYVGGMPKKSERRRRRRSAVVDDSYKGTLQDVQINGIAFHMSDSPINATDLPPSYAVNSSVNMRAGEVTDTLCAHNTLCENNATCYDKFFNDFGCNCTAGYRGKNCSLLDFCMTATCPQAWQCNDLIDGYECEATGTFLGTSQSYVSYTASEAVKQRVLHTAVLTLRTRRTIAVVLHLRGPNDHFLSVQLDAGAVYVSYNLGSPARVASPRKIDDGLPHNVSIVVTTTAVELTVDDMTNSQNSQQSMMLDGVLADVYLGAVPYAYRQAHAHMFTAYADFKGCLSSVRIGNVLLPVFTPAEVGNTTAQQRFDAREVLYVREGCIGDEMCKNHQCENGASCEDIWNKYVCVCTLGFDGAYCENNIDDCALGHDCANGASCIDGIAAYTCQCVHGFVGDRCQTDVDECESSPCQNNATCVDLVGRYECNCTANFTGADCHVSLTDNCDAEPCMNGATCVPVNTSVADVMTFRCDCPPGLTGRVCDVEIDYCEAEPCLNNATCVSNRDLFDYQCLCVNGFTGKQCETNIDDCASVWCQHEGICIDLVDAYRCQCSVGWRGDLCDEDIDECMQKDFQKCGFGVCVNIPGHYECNCSNTGYEGSNCQTDINECLTQSPCLNFATCTNELGSYNCNCSLGYQGRHCEVANCSLVSCQHGFNCTAADQWSCNCDPFYEGDLCEFRGPCVDAPCQNNGRCIQDHANYTCSCEPGWHGVHCEKDVDECTTHADLCRHGGTCINSLGSYECACVSGFVGDHCEVDFDECASSPCLNGGQCVEEQVDSYTCVCAGSGYEGVHCERDVDECSALLPPCQNDATCENLPGEFRCHCTVGYVGDTCHSANPCNSSDYCNKGNCSYSVDDVAGNVTAVCTCPEDWSGSHCQTAMSTREQRSTFSQWKWLLWLCVALVVLILVIVPVIAIRWIGKKRATHGTYSPSRQEMSGSRVEMGNGPKLPPEERLI